MFAINQDTEQYVLFPDRYSNTTKHTVFFLSLFFTAEDGCMDGSLFALKNITFECM